MVGYTKAIYSSELYRIDSNDRFVVQCTNGASCRMADFDVNPRHKHQLFNHNYILLGLLIAF